MNKKIFLSFLLTALILDGYASIKVAQANQPLLVTQAESESVWKPFSSPEGGFTVLFPGQPNADKGNTNTAANSNNLQSFSVLRENEALYVVSYKDVVETLIQNSRNPNKVLASVVSGIEKGSKGKVLGENSISLGNFPGREIRIRLEKNIILLGRIYLVNKRVYQLFVVTNQEANLTKSIDGFFKSFQVLPDSPALRQLTIEDYNPILKGAVCRQNWPQSIQILEQMIPIAPNPEIRSQLVTYQTRLTNLANSREKIPPNLLSDCASGK
jgi:hypothetical protein